MPSMIVFLILLCVVLALVCFAEADIEKPRRSIEIEGSLPHVPDASSCPHRETVSDFHNMLTLPKRFAAHKISFRESVIADLKGPGCVRQIWIVTGLGSRAKRPHFCTHSSDSLSMVLRVYFDGETVPSVRVPLGPMFGIFHDIGDNWRASRQYGADTSLFKISENGAFTFITPMPYSRSVRISIQDENPDVKAYMRIWMQVSYHSYDPRCPFPEPKRLHIAYRLQDRITDFLNTTGRYKRSYHVGHAQGQGYLLGTALGFRYQDTSDFWFHNGGEMVIADHTTNPRVFKGTGGEDFFCSSCWFTYHHTFPDWGYLYGTNTKNFSAYRFFVNDFQIPFQSEISLSYGVNRDHVQSVMYWYQTKPSLQISKHPPLAARLGDSVKDADGKYLIPAPTGEIAHWNLSRYFPFKLWSQSSLDNLHHKQVRFEERKFLNPAFGFLSLGEYFFPYGKGNDGYPTNCFVWLRSVYCSNSTEETPVRIMITHDDPFEIYLNGDLLYSKNMSYAGFQTFNIYTTLDSGENEFQVKVANFDNTNARAYVFGVNLFFNEKRKRYFYLQQRGGFPNAEENVRREHAWHTTSSSTQAAEQEADATNGDAAATQ